MQDTELFKKFCPHCKEEIEYLYYKIIREFGGSIDASGEIQEDDDNYSGNNYTYTAYCPQCDKAIEGIDSDDEAIDWLNGELEE